MSARFNAAGERLVPCPTCRGDSVFAPSNRFRPFCSDRCAGIDFGAWASEAYRVPARADSADLADDDSPAAVDGR
jgi:uncharacterized protein